MADIRGSYDRKGYLTIAANAHAGIAIRKNINEADRRLMNKVWFDTGLKMADGKTPRTVAATSEAEVAEYRKKGFREVGLIEEAPAASGQIANGASDGGQGLDSGDTAAEAAARRAAADSGKNLFDAGAPGEDAPKGGEKSARKRGA